MQISKLLIVCALFITSCTAKFQNYHRADIKTPAQYYLASLPENLQALKKGELLTSASVTSSGQSTRDPKTGAFDKDGKAYLAQLSEIRLGLSYGFQSNWEANARFGWGNTSETVQIANYEQTYTLLDLVYRLSLIGYLTDFSTFPAQATGNIEAVNRKNNFWDASLGAGYFVPSTDKRFSLHFGCSKGASDIVGTTHAADSRIYLTDKNAPPATYGIHRSAYTGFYIQPGGLVAGSVDSKANLGLATKLSYYTNHVESQILGANYSEKINHLLLQPSIVSGFGDEYLRFILAYSMLLPLTNKTEEHFNKHYLHFGLQYKFQLQRQ